MTGPRSLQPEAVAALRAHLGYLRDLGIYDLYRRVPAEGVALALALEVQPVEVQTEALQTEAPLPEVTQTASATKIVTEAEAVSGEAPASPQQPGPPPVTAAPLLTLTPPSFPSEESEIAARKHAPPTQLPAVLPGNILAAGDRPAALASIRAEIGDCTRCQLAFEGRHTIVFGDGNPSARILFVGEGPGADEDAQGIPFIGKAGQLLNNMITAMGLKREEVYIANIVKCRPPGNRVPEPAEANTCTQFLLQQIGVVRPEVIVALGSTAATYLMGGKAALSGLRGRVHPLWGAKLIVTYHPAYLLRDPRQKKEAWADLQIAMRELAGQA
jgi:uracil-DNA glycosylase family 4